MNDNKKLSKDTFNLQATTYDIDKNGAHARTLYPHIIDKLSDISFDNVLDVGCGTGEILNTIKNIYHSFLKHFIYVKMYTCREDLKRNDYLPLKAFLKDVIFEFGNQGIAVFLV